MSKIEVLRVPDERLDTTDDGVWLRGHNQRTPIVFANAEMVATGDAVVLDDGQVGLVVPERYKPALLAALLEDAGARKVSITLGEMGFGNGTGQLWFLPIREEGGE